MNKNIATCDKKVRLLVCGTPKNLMTDEGSKAYGNSPPENQYKAILQV